MIKKFDNFINENLNGDKLYNQLINAVLNVAHSFEPEVEFTEQGIFFQIDLENDNIIKDIEIEEHGKIKNVNIVSINVQMYAFGKPMGINFFEEEGHLPVEFDSIIDKEGFIDFLKVEE